LALLSASGVHANEVISADCHKTTSGTVECDEKQENADKHLFTGGEDKRVLTKISALQKENNGKTGEIRELKFHYKTDKQQRSEKDSYIHYKIKGATSETGKDTEWKEQSVKEGFSIVCFDHIENSNWSFGNGLRFLLASNAARTEKDRNAPAASQENDRKHEHFQFLEFKEKGLNFSIKKHGIDNVVAGVATYGGNFYNSRGDSRIVGWEFIGKHGKTWGRNFGCHNYYMNNYGTEGSAAHELRRLLRMAWENKSRIGNVFTPVVQENLWECVELKSPFQDGRKYDHGKCEKEDGTGSHRVDSPSRRPPIRPPSRVEANTVTPGRQSDDDKTSEEEEEEEDPSVVQGSPTVANGQSHTVAKSLAAGLAVTAVLASIPSVRKSLGSFFAGIRNSFWHKKKPQQHGNFLGSGKANNANGNTRNTDSNTSRKKISTTGGMLTLANKTDSLSLPKDSAKAEEEQASGSAGLITAIILTTAIILLLISVASWLYFRRKNKKSQETDADNADILNPEDFSEFMSRSLSSQRGSSHVGSIFSMMASGAGDPNKSSVSSSYNFSPEGMASGIASGMPKSKSLMVPGSVPGSQSQRGNRQNLREIEVSGYEYPASGLNPGSGIFGNNNKNSQKSGLNSRNKNGLDYLLSNNRSGFDNGSMLSNSMMSNSMISMPNWSSGVVNPGGFALGSALLKARPNVSSKMSLGSGPNSKLHPNSVLNPNSGLPNSGPSNSCVTNSVLKSGGGMVSMPSMMMPNSGNFNPGSGMLRAKLSAQS